MAPLELPPLATLHKLLVVLPDEGSLIWRERPGNTRFNSNDAGRIAGCLDRSNGYVYVRVAGKRALAHRVIWKMVTGDDPNRIDHINGNRTDNRISNLRNVSERENCLNRKIAASNTSGFMGVHFCASRKKWVAIIWRDGASVFLGRFAEKHAAIAARKDAERRFGYHPNHGRK